MNYSYQVRLSQKFPMVMAAIFMSGDTTEEVWNVAPSKRYLCGFLKPSEQAAADDDDEDPREDELLEARDDVNSDVQNDPQSQRRPIVPSSMGLSVLLPPGKDDTATLAFRLAHTFHRRRGSTPVAQFFRFVHNQLENGRLAASSLGSVRIFRPADVCELGPRLPGA